MTRGRVSPQELRDLARQLREQPDELAANLAQLGAVESDVRAQIDPATEQRASALTSLVAIAVASGDRATPTRTATAIPRRPSEDLDKLGEKLDSMTPSAARDAGSAARRACRRPPQAADGAAATACGCRRRAWPRATRQAPGRRWIASARR